MDKGRRLKRVRAVAAVSFASTLVVVTVKLIAAQMSGSISVLAESLQSLLDVAMSAAALWTLRAAARPPDKDHPFGHGKAELLLSAFQMIVVLGASAGIAWEASRHLADPHPIQPDWGIGAMTYSFLANAVIIVLLLRVGREESSPALIGEAEHLRADSLASLGVLAGLGVTKITGWLWLDPAIAIVFTLLGAAFAVRHLLRVLHPLMDGALPAEDLATISTVLDSMPAVRGHHNVLTRQAGSIRIVSLHVLLDDHLTFAEAHDLAEEIESAISTALEGAHVTIHYEPFESELAHRAEAHGETSDATLGDRL